MYFVRRTKTIQAPLKWAVRCPIWTPSCFGSNNLDFSSVETRIDSLPRFEVLVSFSKQNNYYKTKTREVKLLEQRRDWSFIVLIICGFSRGNGAIILFVSKRFTLFRSFPEASEIVWYLGLALLVCALQFAASWINMSCHTARAQLFFTRVECICRATNIHDSRTEASQNAGNFLIDDNFTKATKK